MSTRLRIESMRREHLPEVARLHALRMNPDLAGRAGLGLLQLFYGELIRTHRPPPAFVAVLDDRVVAYAVAVVDAGAIRRSVVRRWWWKLPPLLTAHALRHPASLLRRIRSLFEREPPAPAHEPDPLAQCCPAPRIEFRGIAVDPDAHVPGAPLALMRARLAWAREAGYRGVYFQIEPDNQASIRLCQWAGALPVPETTARRRRRFYIVL